MSESTRIVETIGGIGETMTLIIGQDDVQDPAQKIAKIIMDWVLIGVTNVVISRNEPDPVTIITDRGLVQKTAIQPCIRPIAPPELFDRNFTPDRHSTVHKIIATEITTKQNDLL